MSHREFLLDQSHDRAARADHVAAGQQRGVGSKQAGDRRIALTATESALLDLLSGSPEHVFSREEIIRGVFPSADAENSVDTYVHYVRRKTTPELIETVRGRGYRVGAPS